MTILNRWNFSCLLKESMVAIIPVGNLTIQQRTEESSKISQKEVHFNFRHRLFQRFCNTPVFIDLLLPLYFAPSHCPLRKTCINMQSPIDFLLFSQQRSTVLLDGNWNRWPTQCSRYDCLSGVHKKRQRIGDKHKRVNGRRKKEKEGRPKGRSK